MSSIERLTIQERRGKRKAHFIQNEKGSLRETLMSKANKLRDKIAEQTNNFDFSVQKAMNQTLRQVQKHKQDFEQQQQQIKLVYKGEQYEIKKTLLKEQLHKKLQACKNRYKQKINLIKDKKKKYYTSDGKGKQEKISIEDMLRTAKNKFKFQVKEKTKERNKSEIIHLKKANQKEIINFVQKNYPTQSSLTFQSNKKQYDYQHISIDMIRAKGVRNLQSQIGNQLTPNKLHATEVISLPSYSTKKALIESFKNKNKLYPNDFSRNQQRQVSNAQILSNSERSIFIPLGKVALSNQRKRICTEFQVTNSYKKEPQLSHKRSSQIVDEFVEIQISEKNSKQNVRVFLPLNKKLKTEGNVQVRSKNLKMQGLGPLKTSPFDDDIQHVQMNLLNSQEFDKLSSPKQKHLQKLQKSKIEKEDKDIQGMISINDLCGQGEKQGKETKRIGQNVGLKSILYNKKANQLCRKMIKNQLNSRVHHRKHLTTQCLPLPEAALQSMLLDIKGSHMELQKSIKVQKAKQRESMDRM